MTTRIRMPKGHLELSLGGVNFKPDDTGAFEVPDEYIAGLVNVHGGKVEPGLTNLESFVEQAEAAERNAKTIYDNAVASLKDARANLEAFKNAQKKPAEQQSSNGKK